MTKDLLGYAGKKVVITGAASGMGLAATRMLVELGAEVYALDVRETPESVKKHLSTNLAEKASIDAAMAQLPEKIDRIFTCAGIAGIHYLDQTFSPVDVNLINFVGHRHLIENLLPRMPEGGAIAMIASIGGMGWLMNLKTVMKLLSTPGFDEAKAWLEENQDDPQAIGGPAYKNRAYVFSKECLIAYAKLRSWDLSKRKIRINSLSPGFTETPMLESFGKISGSGTEKLKLACSPVGRTSTPEEQARSLLFLNSSMASYVSGADLPVDYGFSAGLVTGQAGKVF